MKAEQRRLIEDRDKKKNWRKWGPYLTERQWGTVREDYSPYGNAWEFVHTMLRGVKPTAGVKRELGALAIISNC
jgi:hypothetical protein